METEAWIVVDNLFRWMPLVSNICSKNATYEHTDLPLIETTQVIQERPFMHEALWPPCRKYTGLPFRAAGRLLYVDYSAPE